MAIGARPHWLASSSNHVESRDCLTFEPLLGTAFRTVAAIVRAALEMRLAAEAERGERKWVADVLNAASLPSSVGADVDAGSMAKIASVAGVASRLAIRYLIDLLGK